MPCEEVIEGKDEDNPPSEKQPQLTKAKYTSPTTKVFFPALQPWSWKALVHSFPLTHESPFKISTFIVGTGKCNHSDLQAVQALQRTSADAHLSGWHLAHTQGGTWFQ